MPFFRDEKRRLLERPFSASAITAPAPNAGQVLRRDASAGPAIEATLQRRSGMLLAVAAEHRERRLVLGAWGCGVFRNDPLVVAAVFAGWLAAPRFAGAFDEVVFAVYERNEGGPNRAAFQRI